MAGGIVQLTVYGSQDIFLTGKPQITFFKIVYRRNTNFAIESVQQHFIGTTNFGQEMVSIIDKIGDLMNRMYLEIELPKVDLVKNSTYWNTNKDDVKNKFDRIQKFYRLVYDYISENSVVIRKLDVLLKTNNISMDNIEKIMYDPIFIDKLSALRKNLKSYIASNIDFDSITELSDQKLNLIQEINSFDIQIIFNSVVKHANYLKNSYDENNFLKKIQLQKIINSSLYKLMKDFYMKIYNIYLEKENLYKSLLNGSYKERYKFAWVEEIGHAIIDLIDIKIGNQTIDTHTGDWLILFNKISVPEYHIKNYYKMIGNVKSLTIFDDSVKNSYKLIIPLQFWFCRHTGMSLPLIALRYHDIMFTLKLKDLSKLCYVEDAPGLQSIENIQSQYNINLIDAKLYVDYIFLDTDERYRFAQFTHEYLIETVQYNEFKDIIGKQYISHLSFSHPTKFMIWFVQPHDYRENLSGHNKCQWNNFGTNSDKTGYPISSSLLRINSYDRTDPYLDVKFFNYVQPYLYFNRSPTDGVNVYSFSLKPLEHQPSGSINLSRIDDFSIVVDFTNEFINLINSDNYKGAYMGVYTMSYNILRIMNGMAGMAFETFNFPSEEKIENLSI
ncbi:MAG: capsid protein [Satyrvirus sp.]|uniref:Capsid protein n=1 Tax=Satyrvirus sp. TaxID=2487771 RepID=A0A3G5AHW6_9VIRU|nr:MAG: capsid protein [Satyrvirus sp.]